MLGEITNRKLAIISIVFSVIGLSALYFLSLQRGPEKTEVSELGTDSVGKIVSVYGTIVSKQKSKSGHMFLKISDGEKKTDVTIFSNVMKSFEDDSEFVKGRTISVKGTVDEYKGNLQIIPRKKSDIKFFGDGSE